MPPHNPPSVAPVMGCTVFFECQGDGPIREVEITVQPPDVREFLLQVFGLPKSDLNLFPCYR
jgi:hypothetical protein